MIEIDQRFDSLDEWMEWARANLRVFDATKSQELYDAIAQAGFVEPMTRRIVPPAEIDATGPGLREGLAAHGLNSRMRAVLALIDEKLRDLPDHEVRMFAPEAVTPFALRMRGRFVRFLGSEYGHDDAARRALFPVPHQDLTALTLPSDSFDLVMANEVLEHVPDIDAALREIARVLKPGGWYVGTNPFAFMDGKGVVKSSMVDGKVIHHVEPEFHGNPVHPEGGSLVFEIPGWDIVPRAKAAGLGNAHMRFVASQAHGYVTENMGVFILCGQK